MSQDNELIKVERNQRQAERSQLIAAMLEGSTFQEVSKGSDVPLKRAMAYRLLHAVRTRGESALQDGRHGHPVKLRGAARTFLEEYCRQAPSTPSSVIQTLLQERFGLSISTSQINRVRAALGVSNCRRNQGREKKQE
jgi:transposase